MTFHPNPAKDEWAEQTIGILLRTGVILAASVVLFGAILFLTRNGTTTPNYREFHGQPSDLTHVSGIVRDVAAWNARGIIQLGLLLLIATPVVRVAFSIVAFARERDWLYVCVTVIVLTFLLFSLFGAKGY